MLGVIFVTAVFCCFNLQLLLAVKDGEIRMYGAIKSNLITTAHVYSGAKPSLFFSILLSN